MNAKELILSKINAGPELAGMYVSMIINGLSFDEISNLMISSTVDAIVDEAKDNIHIGKSGNIDKAILFIENGPNLRNYLTDIKMQTLWKLVDGNKQKHDEIWNKYIAGNGKNDESKYEFFKTPKPNGKSPSIAYNLGKLLKEFKTVKEFDELVSILEGSSKNGILNQKVSTFDEDIKIKNDNFSISFYRYLAEYRRYIELKEKGIINPLLFKTFKNQYDVAKETKVFGARLGINGGMSTTLEGLLRYDSQLSNFFFNTVREFMNVDPEGIELIDEFVKSLRKIEDDFSLQLRDLTDASRLRKTFFKSELEKSKYEAYKNLVIQLYEVVKKRFNIIEIEFGLDHIDAMITASKVPQSLFENSVTVYDYTKRAIKDLCNKNIIMSDNYHTFDERQLKQIQRFILSDVVRKFFDLNMGDSKYILNEEMDFYYDENFKLQKGTEGSKVKIDLSTPNGRINFTIFMKNFVESERKSNPDNKFINDIILDYQRDPVTNKDYSFLKLNFNMSTLRTNNELFQLENYMIGVDDLSKLNYKDTGLKKSELFVIYNILMHNNAFGLSTFTKLFLDEVKNNNSLITKYMQFVGKLDSSKNTGLSIYPYDSLDLDRLAMTLAPIISPTERSNSTYKYVKVYEKGKLVIKRRTTDSDVLSQSYSDKYKDSVEMVEVEDVPSKLYLSSEMVKGSEINNMKSFEVMESIFKQHKSGDLQILIKC